MKMRTILKKFSAFMLIAAMLTGMFELTTGKVSANASDNLVNMYFCDDQLCYHGAVRFTVYIQIDAKSANHKEVFIHHTLDDSGVWSDTAATYVTKLDDSTEIWKADIASTYEASVEYAVKYIGDGRTYWDNNNGNNYKYKNILGIANVKAGRIRRTYSGLYIAVTVKNLAPNKNVRLRYTLDNWVTYQDADFSYVSEIPGTDSETWSINLNIDESKMNSFQYCVYYEVNGQTYWDSNFGANYNHEYYRYY